MTIEIEIYLPCDPDWFCDALLKGFIALFVLAIVIFLVILWREYRRLAAPTRFRRKRQKRNRAKK